MTAARPLTVAYDVTPVATGATGVARYTAELDQALERRGVVLRRFALGRVHHELPAGTRRIPVPLRVLHRWWRLLHLPAVDRLVGRCDVVHVTDLVPPPTRRPLVLTVHDLDALDHPELHSERARRQQAAQLDAARRRAAAVIADSDATADALRRHGVPPERITVVHLGTTSLPAPDHSRAPTKPYFLFVGTIDERKGLDTLLAAFTSAGMGGVRLVLAGPDQHGAAGIRAEAANRPGVVLLGRVTDAELAGLYDRALALCLPSRAEGFGLPVLEAMAAGTPVIASDLPALREVGGDAAIFVPPGDVHAWTSTLRDVATDALLRDALVASGRERAVGFTWDAAAAATEAIYERVAGSRS